MQRVSTVYSLINFHLNYVREQKENTYWDSQPSFAYFEEEANKLVSM